MVQSLNGMFLRFVCVIALCIGVLVHVSHGFLMQDPPVPVQHYFMQEHPLQGILLASALLVIIVSSLLLWFLIALAVRHDIRSLARMFGDMHDGKLRVDYPMMLGEFARIFRLLRSSGTRLIEEKQQFREMGLIDHLSQLNNRRHFEKKLESLFASSKVNGPSSVLIIDVDHFKLVNDEHGHDAGDALIVGFSAALRKVVRNTDFLARLGGDEFCIIYTYASLDKAKGLVERLRRELPRHINLPKGVVHTLRWTGGLSGMKDSDRKFDDVLWRADQALLEAKQRGRNNTLICAGMPAEMKRKPMHAN